MSGPTIRVNNLNLKLGNNRILDSLDFSVASGEIHCLVGPNGGGKTSTLKCLLGQMPHTGDIHIDWQGETRHIGYVPQFLEFDRSLPVTVDNFMSMVCQKRPAFTGVGKKQRALIDQALQRVALTGKNKRMIGALSGGERQRMLFAQALIPEPSLLILDEPMTSLDEAGAEVFAGLIRDMKAQQVTVLWVNHDLRQVREMADSVSIIDTQLLGTGPVAETLTEDMLHGDFRAAQNAVRGVR